MKVINVSELKANLSRYLRMASRGQQVIVKDRNEPIAQIGPLEAPPEAWPERLERGGRLRLGTQAWDRITISELARPVDIQASLRAVREESGEVRGR